MLASVPSLPLKPSDWINSFKQHHTQPWMLFKQITAEHGPYVLMVRQSDSEAFLAWVETLYPIGWHVLNLEEEWEASSLVWLFSCEWSGNNIMDVQKALRLLHHLNASS